jgi:hypothetical protein
MYAAFYVGALANLPEIEDLFSHRSPRESQFVAALITTAAITDPRPRFPHLRPYSFAHPRGRDQTPPPVALRPPLR